MKKLFLLLVVVFLSSKVAVAQNYSGSVTSITKEEIKEYYKSNIELKEGEEKQFWEIYDQYVNELKPATEKANELLIAVAKNNGEESIDAIDKKILSSLDIQSKVVSIRAKYYKLYKEKISKSVASQFYQVDIYVTTYLAASLNEELPVYNAK